MRVNIELPPQKSDPMLKQLLTQFQAFQKQMLKAQAHEMGPDQSLLKMMGKQQDRLLKAIEQMSQRVRSSEGNSSGGASSPALLKRLDRLQDALTSAMKRYRTRTFGSNY